jgi:hypothetical protein
LVAPDGSYWTSSSECHGACIFWLKIRCKDRWRDVQNIDAEIGHYIILSPTSITNGARAREREILTSVNHGLCGSELKKIEKSKKWRRISKGGDRASRPSRAYNLYRELLKNPGITRDRD